MIAVDTNVLVRLSDTVLVELTWTLARAYGRSRAEVAKALRALSAHATVLLESAAAVRSATDAFERGPADIADCLLCEKAALSGCEYVATFDRGMKGLNGVTLLR